MGARILPALLLVILGASFISAERNLMITAPDVFHLAQEEIVWVNLMRAGNPMDVEIYLQDYPDRTNMFGRNRVRVNPFTPLRVPITIEAGDLPETDEPIEYVYLVAKFGTLQKETRVLLSTNSYRVFIQTDKPVYTPRQQVYTRVYTMNQDMRPASIPVQMDIMNPQGVIVYRNQLDGDADGILSMQFDLPDILITGNWSCVASYGHEMRQNVTSKFEVKEYVLPSFGVKIISPEFILPGQNITAHVQAMHTYGKPVSGIAKVKIGVVKDGLLTMLLQKTQQV